MSAGTITLTNGSAVVGGTGTSFATELAAGDFIVSTVGGVDYTLPVKSVESNAQLTLVSNFTGPTQSGAAWSAVPRVALNMVTAALVAQSAEALRGLNYDKQNWQSIFSGTGNVTVTLPDGTAWTGPAWNSITSSLNSITESLFGKAEKGANSDITSLSGLTTALSVAQGGTGSTTASGARTNLGLGNSATSDVGTTSGTVAAGDDARLSKLTVVTSPAGLQVIGARLDAPAGIACHGGANSNATVDVFSIYWTAAAGPHLYINTSDLGQFQLNTSDERLKEKVRDITDESCLERVIKQNIVEYQWKDKEMRGDQTHRGFIAQQVGEIDPMLITGSEDSQYGLDLIALLADAYGAIKGMKKQIDELSEEIANMKIG